MQLKKKSSKAARFVSRGCFSGVGFDHTALLART